MQASNNKVALLSSSWLSFRLLCNTTLVQHELERGKVLESKSSLGFTSIVAAETKLEWHFAHLKLLLLLSQIFFPGEKNQSWQRSKSRARKHGDLSRLSVDRRPAAGFTLVKLWLSSTTVVPATIWLFGPDHRAHDFHLATLLATSKINPVPSSFKFIIWIQNHAFSLPILAGFFKNDVTSQ